MTVQAKTPDIADIAGVADIGAGTGAPTLQPCAHQAATPATLTCSWVRDGDGALVMRWTAQTPADAHEEITAQTPADAHEETTKAAA
jgi:hypothetical protein